jgi:nucleoredoxin
MRSRDFSRRTSDLPGMKAHHLFLPLLLLFLAAARAATIEQLAADPQLWPTEVTITAATKVTLIKNGQPGGMMLVGAGKKLTVTGVAPDGVTGKLGGSTVKVAVDKTDLLAAPGAAVAPAADATGTPATAAAPESASRSAPVAGPPSAMQRLFSAKLLRYANGKPQNLATADLAGVKYFALYYSASWCGPCRRFTPQLVQAYQELKQAHPEFEVIFLSADRSSGDMLGYMREDRMPWPAVKFDQREQKMMDYSGPGIPCLVLVDANGKVLSDSYRGDDYLGPQHVLAETRRILSRRL